MKFSVIVPAFNPDPDQLLHCLGSIYQQLDLRHNEIIVIDDHSPDASVCRRVVYQFPGVRLHRTDRELWGCATTNLGFAMAKGELLHVVHPDDAVLQGFYRTILQAAEQVPDVALYVTDHIECDERLRPFDAPQIDWLAGGKFQPLHAGNPLAVAATVVRRSYVEKHGGWDVRLPHTADWHFAHRAATLGGACHIGAAKACYRHSASNHTGRLKRSADNIRDYVNMAKVVEEYAPVDWPAFYAYVARRARVQVAEFAARGDHEAAAMNEAYAKELEKE